MSRSRVLSIVAAACSLAAFAIAQTVTGAMVTPGSADSPGIAVEPGGALLRRAPIRNPPVSTAGGKVILEATLDAQGNVADARVISGPMELRNTALSSVLQWHYQPGPPLAQIAIQFPAIKSIDLTPAVPGVGFGPSAGPGAEVSPGVYRPGGAVSNPIPISRPEPELSEEARKAKVGGTVLLSLVIDENGLPTDIHVRKPLGLGLDEKAIEAVSKWRFRPGLKNGVPVRVAAQIEVTFKVQ